MTIVHDDYLAKNPQAVAKFIAAVRKALEFGAKNASGSPRSFRKREHEPRRRARLRGQWEGAYMASFEPHDVASLKRLQEIAKAAGAVKKDAPDSAFVDGAVSAVEADQISRDGVNE